MKALFLGGARSGKSAAAEAWILSKASSEGPAPVYIATAEAFDDEMAARIAQHQTDRGPRWRTVEAPHALPEALAATAMSDPDAPVLVDCLTLWLSNRLLAEEDLEADAEALIGALNRAPGPVALVSNEVGLSVVPDNALARRFRDAQGRLNQRVAAEATLVRFCAAGLWLTMKGSDEPAAEGGQ